MIYIHQKGDGFYVTKHADHGICDIKLWKDFSKHIKNLGKPLKLKWNLYMQSCIFKVNIHNLKFTILTIFKGTI